MTPDQWFTFAISALSVAGVLGGFLVGSRIVRKNRKPEAAPEWPSADCCPYCKGTGLQR